MSKKQQPLTPLAYLKSGRALRLPVYKCYVTEHWREIKKFYLVFSRQHVNGNITTAVVLVDLLCTGIKDVICQVNIPIFEFERLLDDLREGGEDTLTEVSHELAHNIVYGALEYGSENGIRPHEDFRWAACIIGPDSDDIPLMDDIPFGENGMPLLLVEEDDPKEAYFLRQLKSHLGEGNFRVMRQDDYYDEDFDEEVDEEEDLLAEVNEVELWEREDWERWIDSMETLDLDDIGDKRRMQAALFYVYSEYNFPVQASELDIAEIIGTPVEWTDEVIETEYGVIYPPELEDEIAEQSFILKGDPTKKEALKVRDRLSLLIREYPHIPNLYNLRYHATRLIDGLGKFRKEVESTLERFPDYFFAKLDLIDAMIEAGETPNLADFFGDARNLSAIFPDRKEFHQSEVTKFFTVMINYHLHVRESALAFAYYQEFIDTGLEDNLPRALALELMAACSLEAVAVLGLVANDADFRESFFEILLDKGDDEDE